MKVWQDFYSGMRKERVLEKENALSCYAELHAAFVRIHPFSEGNGRMARLLANISNDFVKNPGFYP